MDKLNIFLPLTKVDESQRLVSGVFSAEVVDKSGEIMDYTSGKPAFEKWSQDAMKRSDGKSLGNVRAMHTNIAAGKLTELSFDDVTKTVHGTAKIIDDNEWNKVLEGVYTGFSIGGAYAKRWADEQNPKLYRFTPELAEISIVDNPCVGKATFDLIRADGSTEMRKFKTADTEPKPEDDDTQSALSLKKRFEGITEPTNENSWVAKDGTKFTKKEDAFKHNAALEKAAAEPVNPALAAVAKLTAAIEKLEDPDANKAKPHLAKGLYDVGRLACLISELEWLASDLAWEAMYEGDMSPLGAELKGTVGTLCEFLKRLVIEEADELMASQKSIPNDELLKDLTPAHVALLNAFLTKVDTDKYTDLNTLLTKSIDTEPKPTEPAPAQEPEPAAAMQKLQNDHAEAMQKKDAEILEHKNTVEALSKSLGQLAERVEAFARQPAAAKGALYAVNKGHEVTAPASPTNDPPVRAQGMPEISPWAGRI